MLFEMVVPRNVDNTRWLRRYKTFFIIGILILCFQLFLAFQFFTLNPSYSNWSPHKLSKSEIFESDNNVNSARRIKDGLSMDDEDMRLGEKDKKSRKHNEKNQLNKTNIRLRLEELDFVPVCEITTKEAISAIHRAKTQKCKQEISNTTCLIQKGMLYPKTLPNFCESKYSHLAGKSLGCFKDDKNFRILSGYYGNNKDKNSPEYCIYLCLQSGFSFAGVQYSTECFCGNEEPSLSLKLPDSSCNMKCPSDTHLICGGYYTMNIYYTGVKKFTAQVANESTSSSGAKVKVVFLLTLNGRALRQVKRLIKNLFHRDLYFYIHVDIRQDYLFRELLKLEKAFKNIKVTRKRFATIWGGASLLKMLLSSMKEILQMDWTWDFIINLSESDYPVKTVKRLVEFLSANKGKNFVKSHGREVQRFIQKQGLDKTFIECDTHMWRTGDRKLPWGVQIDGGSDWVALSHDFVQYVANQQPDELVTGLILLFKYTLLPAESFFHTVLRNSFFCNSYVDNNLHVTNWKRKLGCKCQYKHVVDWCGCSPNDFKPEDWLRVQNTESRQLFFARKFEPIINQAIILKLEEWLYGIDLSTKIKNINSYWHSVYNHLDVDVSDDALLTVPLLDDTIAFGEEETNIANKDALKHPFVTIWHILFRGAAIVTYMVCGLFSNSFITSFVVVVLLLSMDFWTVKNITGRFMVGLRWWNYVASDGQSHWVFESRKDQEQNRTNEREARIFWTALILAPLLWSLFFIISLFSFDFKWMLLVIIALILNGANLYGYIKCKVGQSQSLSAVTSDFFRTQVLQGAVSMVSKQAMTPNSNPMSPPTNTV